MRSIVITTAALLVMLCTGIVNAVSFVDAVVWWHMDEYGGTGPVYPPEDLKNYNGNNTNFNFTNSMPNGIGPVWVQGPSAGPGGGSTFLHQPDGLGGAVEFRKDRGDKGDEARFAGDALKINGDITMWFRLKIDMTASAFMAMSPTTMAVASNLNWNGTTVQGWALRVSNYTEIGGSQVKNAPQLTFLWGQNELGKWNQVWTGTQYSLPMNEWIEISACVDTVHRQARITSYSQSLGLVSSAFSLNDANNSSTATTIKGLYNYTTGPAQIEIGGVDYDNAGPHANKIDMTLESAAIWKTAMSLQDIEALSSYEFMTVCGEQGILAGDLNKDCTVDMQDIALIASDWLACTDPGKPACASAL